MIGEEGKGVSGWAAELELRFQQRAGRTVLAHARHSGPLRVQRPFYPEGDGACHVYLLHPPGGVVGGDRLDIAIEVGAGAQALLTTPAAGKLYRSAGPTAIQAQHLRVGPGAALEWLPQENIAFDGARAEVRTLVDLAGDARFIGWEILCLGRPAGGERFLRGECRQRFEVWRDGRPLWIDRARLAGGSEVLQEPWGLAGYPVTGTLVCVGCGAGLADRIREAAAHLADDAWLGVTELDQALICRYLGQHAERARRCFTRAWEVMRPAALGREACMPRIWRT